MNVSRMNAIWALHICCTTHQKYHFTTIHKSPLSGLMEKQIVTINLVQVVGHPGTFCLLFINLMKYYWGHKMLTPTL